MIRVLWFSPVPLPAVCEELKITPSYGGNWIHSLLQALSGEQALELAVAWAYSGCRTRRSFQDSGVRYYITPNPGWLVRGDGFVRKVTNRLEPFLGTIRDKRAVAESLGVVADFAPDLVHVFGAEHRHGLIAPLIQVPTVIWIQGILDVYRHHYFGGAPWHVSLSEPRLLAGYWRMVAEAVRERYIYSSCRDFIGRTRWDAAHLARLQPEGRYHDVQECVRSEFLQSTAWQVDSAAAQTIYTTTSAALLKGTDVLGRAARSEST